jgi:DNA-directed RNA polymerase subunit RPC12/RpoP
MTDYTCDRCGGTFARTRSDEEAAHEATVLWGVPSPQTDPAMALVCEECFHQVMAWLHRRTSARPGAEE